MARPIFLSIPMQSLQFSWPSISFLYTLIATMSIFFLVTFVCSFYKTKKSHRKIKEEIIIKNVQSGVEKLDSRMNDTSFSTKALSMVKMISWRKLQADEEDSADDDQTSSEKEVWKKTIMRGERCRPLDFSGKIVYDSQGNLLQESPPGNLIS